MSGSKTEKNNSLHVRRSSVHFAPSEVIPDSTLTDPSSYCDVEGTPNDVGPHNTVFAIFCRHV